MILAQAALAKSGIISGVGFAIAKIIGSLFIDSTIFHVKTHGAETQINISFQITASFKSQLIFSLLVISNIFNFSEFKSVLFLDTIHLLSHTIISHTQYNFNSLIIAVQAAHNQFTTILISFLSLFIIFKLFIKPAKTTIAVQCWSS
jgi:hypothetical protein